MRRPRGLLAALAVLATPALADPPTAPRASTGITASGAKWQAQVPANWNGTLLLWARGWSPQAGEPAVAPPEWREALLAQGYALAASNYGASGWALAEAVPAQDETVRAFAAIYGKPRRTIAWGASMGGLVTTALAEQPRSSISAAIAFCPSIGGAVGMMNMALDGAFAFRTLLAPDADIALVGPGDDMANARRAAAAVDLAAQHPQGRARLALAAVLGGIPGWTRRDHARPAEGDVETQLDEIAAAFAIGVIVPRAEQEQRAGGNFSWNNGIDYRRQLDRSGRRAFVEALYRKAGLDLGKDLARLADAPRITADPQAVDYMMRNYTPSARPVVPILSVQAIGDGQTSPALQRAYLDEAPRNLADGLWIDAAGHCGMSKEVALTALRHVEARLATGRWPRRATGTIRHTAQPMMRPCLRGGRCD